jgi:hypothetical protein
MAVSVLLEASTFFETFYFSKLISKHLCVCVGNEKPKKNKKKTKIVHTKMMRSPAARRAQRGAQATTTTVAEEEEEALRPIRPAPIVPSPPPPGQVILNIFPPPTPLSSIHLSLSHTLYHLPPKGSSLGPHPPAMSPYRVGVCKTHAQLAAEAEGDEALMAQVFQAAQLHPRQLQEVWEERGLWPGTCPLPLPLSPPFFKYIFLKKLNIFFFTNIEMTLVV